MGYWRRMGLRFWLTFVCGLGQGFGWLISGLIFLITLEALLKCSRWRPPH